MEERLERQVAALRELVQQAIDTGRNEWLRNALAALGSEGHADGMERELNALRSAAKALLDELDEEPGDLLYCEQNRAALRALLTEGR